MFAFVEDVVRNIEENLDLSTRQQILDVLRAEMGVDDFGYVLMTMPNPQFPRISKLLPAMASDTTQNNWTGNSGVALLRETCSFVRALTYNYQRITGLPPDGRHILDYGCGYGRIARLMWYFTETQKLFGLDPWTASIDECSKCSMGNNFSLSDYMPQSLPLARADFSLVYAFSVFTHLSKEAALTAFAAVRRYTAAGGVFAITIRPIEYWELAEETYGFDRRKDCESWHRRDGFAFVPHGDGTGTYGDTSMTFDWLRDNVSGWTIQSVDRSLEDDVQVYVFLRAI